MFSPKLLSVIALALTAGSVQAAGISYPEAPIPPADSLIKPPAETTTFPIRKDGQAFNLEIDSTVNMTDSLNRHYYDFNWRGEVWAPFDNCTTAEKGVRLMNTWPEYNAATQGRIFTGWHLFWEKWSGFGPQ